MTRTGRRLRAPAAVVAALMSCAGAALAERDLPIGQLRLPPGFQVSVYAERVPFARQMALAPDGSVFVGSRQSGDVRVVRDTNHDGKADEVFVVARGMDSPNGVAFRDGALYVGAVSHIFRFDGILSNPRAKHLPVLVTDALPDNHWHGWRVIAFGPDGWLYVAVGAPCNVCEPDRKRYGGIFRMRPDGSGLERFATGVRNSVGFDWDPKTGQLWFTDNGRDMMGDDLPSDELNHAPRAGMDFGFPYCHQGDTPDPEYGAGRSCSLFTPPVAKLGAHVASLGMRFYRGNMFPKKYRGAIFIAEHGSWNRSSKVGYRVVAVWVDGGRLVREEPFIEGWLQGQRAWGRPVDVQELADGSLLISDDGAGTIYRVTYRPGSGK